MTLISDPVFVFTNNSVVNNQMTFGGTFATALSKGAAFIFPPNGVVKPNMINGGVRQIRPQFSEGIVYTRFNNVVKPNMIRGGLRILTRSKGLVSVTLASTGGSGPKQTWG